MMLDVDPSVLIAAVTTAAANAAPAVKGTAASVTAAAASPDVIKTLEALQKSVQTLPATVASIPAMKSAIAAASAALAKSGATAQTAVLTKQLAAVSKALSAAAAKAGASATAATPAPVKAAAASATAAVSPIVKEVAAAIKAVSRDTDNDLFNGYPFNAPALVVWASSVVAFSSIANADNEVPYAAGDYDPAKAEGYFAQRWFLKFGRALQLLSTLGTAPADAPPAPPGPTVPSCPPVPLYDLSASLPAVNELISLVRALCAGPWGVGLARDKWENGGANWERNQPMRAKQILKICTRLGTTAIKIGQALSIRGDLLPAPYVKELSELQDKARARRRAAAGPECGV